MNSRLHSRVWIPFIGPASVSFHLVLPDFCYIYLIFLPLLLSQLSLKMSFSILCTWLFHQPIISFCHCSNWRNPCCPSKPSHNVTSLVKPPLKSPVTTRGIVQPLSFVGSSNTVLKRLLMTVPMGFCPSLLTVTQEEDGALSIFNNIWWIRE